MFGSTIARDRDPNVLIAPIKLSGVSQFVGSRPMFITLVGDGFATTAARIVRGHNGCRSVARTGEQSVEQHSSVVRTPIGTCNGFQGTRSTVGCWADVSRRRRAGDLTDRRRRRPA